MNLPEQIQLSELLRHVVRCDKGLPHGSGSFCWMHPPVHRILGWASSPSNLRMSRDVWRLDQLRAIADHNVYVKGEPSITDQATLDRLPTLIDADMFNKKGEKLGKIVDLIFYSTNGKILNYLISRSDPRIPGTSRWRLSINNIIDQQPGMVSTNLLSLDDLPLSKTGLRQNFLKKTRTFRDQIQDFSDRATDKLEGWLEESQWEEELKDKFEYDYKEKPSYEYDDWVDENYKNFDFPKQEKKEKSPIKYKKDLISEDDPWI